MRGLPDFGAPLGVGCFAAFDQPGGVLALPGSLGLATDAAGVPRLTLERFRSSNPAPANQAYGLVSARFTMRWPELADDRAVTGRVIPDAGTLTVRLDQVNGDPLVIGTPMAWDGSLTAPWGARVTPELITWMIEALGMRLLPLHAHAVLSVRGVAPRLPVRLEVNGDRLAAVAPEAGPESLTALIGELAGTGVPSDSTGGTGVPTDSTGGAGVPTDSTGQAGVSTRATGAVRVLPGSADDVSAEAIARVILDRLNSDLPRPSGTEVWDLSRPFVTRRPVTVDRLLSDELRHAPIDASVMVPPGTELPSLQLGWHSLDVLSNLPDRSPGVLACGVNVMAPPRPPARPQPAIAGCELTAEQPRQRITLRLAVGERLDYVSEAWLVVDGPGGTREVPGPSRTRTGQRLIVGPDDVGVRFANVSVDDAVLRLGSVEVALRQGAWTGETVTLDAEHPEAAFALTGDDSPAGGEPYLQLSVHALAGEGVIDLPDRPARHHSLGLAAIPGWGAHTVRLVNATAAPRAVEVAGEDATGSAVLHLDAGATRDWHWLVTDPFRPGYRYRLRPVGEPGPWHGPLTDPVLTIGADS